MDKLLEVLQEYYTIRSTGLCPFCKGEIGEFRDELSKREYGISGLCQKCQDEVFKEENDE